MGFSLEVLDSFLVTLLFQVSQSMQQLFRTGPVTWEKSMEIGWSKNDYYY